MVLQLTHKQGCRSHTYIRTPEARSSSSGLLVELPVGLCLYCCMPVAGNQRQLGSQGPSASGGKHSHQRSISTCSAASAQRQARNRAAQRQQAHTPCQEYCVKILTLWLYCLTCTHCWGRASSIKKKAKGKQQSATVLLVITVALTPQADEARVKSQCEGCQRHHTQTHANHSGCGCSL